MHSNKTGKDTVGERTRKNVHIILETCTIKQPLAVTYNLKRQAINNVTLKIGQVCCCV